MDFSKFAQHITRPYRFNIGPMYTDGEEVVSIGAVSKQRCDELDAGLSRIGGRAVSCSMSTVLLLVAYSRLSSALRYSTMRPTCHGV